MKVVLLFKQTDNSITCLILFRTCINRRCGLSPIIFTKNKNKELGIKAIYL